MTFVSFVNKLRMLVVTDTSHITFKSLSKDYSPAGGCEFKEGQRGANNRIQHLFRTESDDKVRKDRPTHRVMQMLRTL